MILCFYNIIRSHILVDTGGGVILFNFELGSISPNLLNLNKPLFDNNRKTPLRLILSKNLEFETNWCQKYNHTFNLLYRSLIPLNRHYLCHKMFTHLRKTGRKLYNKTLYVSPTLASGLYEDH